MGAEVHVNVIKGVWSWVIRRRGPMGGHVLERSKQGGLTR